ncbi:heat shock protein 70 (HSP70)-interacting-like protein [Dinothrombium tinctorium]|uniref:RNA polymerase II-associated protein 3 n=1 Tax=Dinothrombium tinctorium TaxID=1965070 RepID=A0A443QYC7_9ACAR|nr:heat shock protein 70 (HSP70)-interacting-like protein [Dinothrombium tinctorium]RWS08158.1 heat shock protein 70 (HSP70)-interacting-like protein [Dinothrombium tinctorium]
MDFRVAKREEKSTLSVSPPLNLASVHFQGNDYFKKGLYKEAIDCYTNAITFDDSSELLFGNRAQCYLNLNMPLEAERDCCQALSKNPVFVKALYRRGIARKQLHRYNQALNDFEHVLKLDSNNKQAKSEIEAIKRLLQSSVNIEIKPISKSSAFRSKQPLINVPIEEVDMKKFPIALPNNMPTTSYQFYRDWKELRGENIDLKLQYLLNIGAINLSKIFSNSIEPEMFCEILPILEQCNDNYFVYTLLSNFTKISRFGSLVLFLQKPDKEILRRIISKILKNGNNVDDLLACYHL